METVDIIGLLVPATYFVFLVTERIWPARTFPAREGWQWIGLGFLVMVMTLSTVIPLLIPEPWLAQHRFLDGTRHTGGPMSAAAPITDSRDNRRPLSSMSRIGELP